MIPPPKIELSILRLVPWGQEHFSRRGGPTQNIVYLVQECTKARRNHDYYVNHTLKNYPAISRPGTTGGVGSHQPAAGPSRRILHARRRLRMSWRVHNLQLHLWNREWFRLWRVRWHWVMDLEILNLSPNDWWQLTYDSMCQQGLNIDEVSFHTLNRARRLNSLHYMSS